MRHPTPAFLLPADEAKRLHSLRANQLWYTPPERAFVEIVALSAQVFGLPVSFLALVEAEKVAYKTIYGLPGLHVYPRAETLCAITIQLNKSFILHDVAQAQHVLLTEVARTFVRAKGINFYAGAPLRLPDAQPVGTLCVVDLQPRHFSVGEQHLLEQLAQVLSLMLAARQTCLTTQGLGWTHWQVVEEQLAVEVMSLRAWLSSLCSPQAAMPPASVAQLMQRLQIFDELLREYQPIHAARRAPANHSETIMADAAFVSSSIGA